MKGRAWRAGSRGECRLAPRDVVKPGKAILGPAAAGGMGVILSQWARALGAIVIGTVGSDEKAAVALANGCHHVINYRLSLIPISEPTRPY